MGLMDKIGSSISNSIDNAKQAAYDNTIGKAKDFAQEKIEQAKMAAQEKFEQAKEVAIEKAKATAKEQLKKGKIAALDAVNADLRAKGLPEIKPGTKMYDKYFADNDDMDFEGDDFDFEDISEEEIQEQVAIELERSQKEIEDESMLNECEKQAKQICPDNRISFLNKCIELINNKVFNIEELKQERIKKLENTLYYEQTITEAASNCKSKTAYSRKVIKKLTEKDRNAFINEIRVEQEKLDKIKYKNLRYSTLGGVVAIVIVIFCIMFRTGATISVPEYVEIPIENVTLEGYLPSYIKLSGYYVTFKQNYRRDRITYVMEVVALKDCNSIAGELSIGKILFPEFDKSAKPTKWTDTTMGDVTSSFKMSLRSLKAGETKSIYLDIDNKERIGRISSGKKRSGRERKLFAKSIMKTKNLVIKME